MIFNNTDESIPSTNAVTVYLVDDDEDDRMFFGEALSEINQKTAIITYSNGVDLIAGLFSAKCKLPDILFIDLNMPLMNGEECIADIRCEPRFNFIPIIIYATVCDEVQLRNLKSIGANGYLQKPDSFQALQRKLETTIHRIIKRRSEDSDSNSFFIS